MKDRYRMVNDVRVKLTKSEQVILEAQEKIAKLEYEKQLPSAKRSKAYKSIPDQLDMLYHELKEFGEITKYGEWFKHIEAIKKDNPIDVEEP